MADGSMLVTAGLDVKYIKGSISELVPYGCYNKVPQSRWLKQMFLVSQLQ